MNTDTPTKTAPDLRTIVLRLAQQAGMTQMHGTTFPGCAMTPEVLERLYHHTAAYILGGMGAWVVNDEIMANVRAEAARAALAAAPAAAIPAGWRLVPECPYEAQPMIAAFIKAELQPGGHESDCYRAMLAAAPAAPAAPAAAQPIPAHIVREAQRAIEAAEKPEGMSTHDGKAVIPASYLRHLLAAAGIEAGTQATGAARA